MKKDAKKPTKKRLTKFKRELAARNAKFKKEQEEYKNSLPEPRRTIVKALGYEGRMMSFSKSSYSNRYPSHVNVFNSNVIVDGKKIWYGDLDLTLDTPKLKELAKALNSTVYVLSEMDGRFENEDKPKLERARLIVSPDGTWSTPDEWYKNAVKEWRGNPLYKKEFQR